jgi:uncharacterized protein
MSYALITGASKGIGKAIAIELASRKYNLILVARTESLLTELSQQLSTEYKIDCRYIAADLTNSEDVKKVRLFVGLHELPLSILVNNAGYGLWGRIDKVQPVALTDMMTINMLTPVELTSSLLPILKKQKQSFILNVASTAAYQAVPTLAVYSASKAFVVLFSRALNFELKGTNVSVTCLSPGTTETNFMNAAGMHSPSIQKKAAKFNMTPSDVAKFAVKGMFAKKTEIIPGWVNKISVALTYYAPKFMTEKIAAGIYKE